MVGNRDPKTTVTFTLDELASLNDYLLGGSQVFPADAAEKVGRIWDLRRRQMLSDRVRAVAWDEAEASSR